MTSVEPIVERLCSLEELVELRRNTLRYAGISSGEKSAISIGGPPSRFATFSKARNGRGLTHSKAVMLSTDQSARNEI
jgi:hypothetical protein